MVLNASNQGIYIDRNSGIILRDLFKMLKRGQLDIKKVPDVTVIGEEGIDAEGLTKEFFTLVMVALTSDTGGYLMFEGQRDHLVPVISEEFHQSGCFKYVGQLIGMSVLHSGVGMIGLSRGLTIFMVTEDVEVASCHLSVKDVPDYCIQQALIFFSRGTLYLQYSSGEGKGWFNLGSVIIYSIRYIFVCLIG